MYLETILNRIEIVANVAEEVEYIRCSSMDIHIM